MILVFKVYTNQFCWPGLGTGPALGWGSQHIAQQQQQVLRGGGVSTHHYHYSLFFYNWVQHNKDNINFAKFSP